MNTRCSNKKYINYLAIISIILLNSCNKVIYTPNITADQQTTNNIALFVPQSGPNKAIGIAIQNAVELGLLTNNNHNFSLAIYDTNKLSTEIAKAKSKKFAIILGPVFAKHIPSITTLAAEQHIYTLSFSNDMLMNNKQVFTMGFDYFRETEMILSYAIAQGKKNIYAIIPSNSTATIIQQAIRIIQKRCANDVKINVIKYDTNIKDIVAKVQNLPTEGIDCIFIPEGGKTLSRIMSAMLYNEVNLAEIQLLGTSLWDDKITYNNHALAGALFTLPIKKYKRFTASYASNYHQKPSKIAGIAFDAINMLIDMQNSNYKAFNKQNLMHYKHRGINGMLQLNSNFTAKRELFIARIIANKVKIIKHIKIN